MDSKKNVIREIKKARKLVICAADVVRITGKHYNTARKMLAKVREAYGKQPGSMVTVVEFSLLFEIDEELIHEFIS